MFQKKVIQMRIVKFIKKHDSFLSLIMLFFSVGIFASIIFLGNRKYNKLKNKGAIEQAYIYKIDQTTRSYILYYKFMYQKQVYLGEYSFSYWEKRGRRLSYKYYPVIFDPKNLDNTSLLIFDSDFERYGFVTPDSIINR